MTFEEFYRRYYALMVRRCRWKTGESDVEDIVSDAFVLLFQKWDTIDPHAPAVLLSWFYQTLDYKILEHKRNLPKDCPLWEDAFPDDAEEPAAPQEEEEQYRSYLQQIVLRLTPAEAEVFRCLIEEELNYREAAECLGISEVALRVRWMRTRNRIRTFWPEIR